MSQRWVAAAQRKGEYIVVILAGCASNTEVNVLDLSSDDQLRAIIATKSGGSKRDILRAAQALEQADVDAPEG